MRIISKFMLITSMISMLSCAHIEPVNVVDEIMPFELIACDQGFFVTNIMQMRNISDCLTIKQEDAYTLILWLNDRYFREQKCMSKVSCRMILALVHSSTFVLHKIEEKEGWLRVFTGLNKPLGQSVTFDIQRDTAATDERVEEKIISQVVI